MRRSSDSLGFDSNAHPLQRQDSQRRSIGGRALDWKRSALAGGLCVLSAMVWWSSGRWSFAALTFVCGVTLWMLVSELSSRAKLKRLVEEGRRLAGAASLPNLLLSVNSSAADLLAALDGLHSQIGAVVAREEALLHEEEKRRAQAEEELQQSKERYALAVSGANDGMWEWNYKTRKAYFSPRAKSMLGYAEDEIGDDIAEWRARVHPEDLELALVELQVHLDDRSNRFEFEHRMRHKDGTWRWVLARAAVIRHANGKPGRLVGLYTDITARKQVQQVLLELADGSNGLRGEDAYAALVEKFADIIGAREAFLAECCDHPATRVRMLAHWNLGQFVACETFDLAGTPCEDVILGGELLFVPRGASERWPAERQWGTTAYLGLPCIDTKGTVIGHIACKNGGEIARDLPHEAILKLFAVRASVEMERQFLERMRGGAPAAASSMTVH